MSPKPDSLSPPPTPGTPDRRILSFVKTCRENIIQSRRLVERTSADHVQRAPHVQSAVHVKRARQYVQRLNSRAKSTFGHFDRAFQGRAKSPEVLGAIGSQLFAQAHQTSDGDTIQAKTGSQSCPTKYRSISKPQTQTRLRTQTQTQTQT